MKPRFLLGTNVPSESVRPRPHRELLEKLRVHRLEVATAALVLHELFFGVYRLPPSRKRVRLMVYLQELASSSMPILPYDRTAAAWHAQERSRLEALGRSLPFVDAPIAAIARVNGLILVTANLRHFEQLPGLSVESWKDSPG